MVSQHSHGYYELRDCENGVCFGLQAACSKYCLMQQHLLRTVLYMRITHINLNSYQWSFTEFWLIVIKATGPHISWMNWTCHSQLIWRLATQIYRNCHRTWLRHHNWWNGDESNFPTLSKNIEQRREVHRIGQQTTISAFLHLRNLMYGGVNQRFPSNGNLIERGSQKI